MPPNRILTCDKLIEQLEYQRGAFTEILRPLRADQEARLEKVGDLISKDPKLLNDKQRKARTIYISIKRFISYEVFLLSALATTITALSWSKLGDYIGNITIWWTAVAHPNGLRAVASLKLKTPTAPVDDEQNLNELPAQPAAKRVCISESRSPVNNAVQLEPPPPSLHRPSHQPQVSIQRHQLVDLIGFLQQYKDVCPELQMVCSWDGNPLPYIRADLGPESSFKIELSVRTSQTFMEYISSRTAAGEEVPQ